MKRIISLLLVIILLISLTTALASTPGSSSDPLISKSYVDTTFKTEVRSEAKSKALSSLTYSGAAGGYVSASLNTDEYALLSSGSSFMLLSGSAKISSISGTVIDVSTGETVSSGTSLSANRRYFCAEDTSARFTAASAVSCLIDGKFTKGSTPIETPKPKAVVANDMTIKVNGTKVKMEAYNIDGNTYYKLRDIAMLMKDTGSEFGVEFDNSVKLVSVTVPGVYAPVGGELKTGTNKAKSCIVSPWSVQVNGATVRCYVYSFQNNNFFKLRDLGNAIGFSVGYDNSSRTVTIDSAEYSGIIEDAGSIDNSGSIDSGVDIIT